MPRTRYRRVEADAVVGDFNEQRSRRAVRSVQPDVDPPGTGVLGAVVHRLLHDAEDFLLDALVEQQPAVRGVDAHLEPLPGRDRRRVPPDRHDQPLLVQRGRP